MGRMLQHHEMLMYRDEPYADTATLLYFLLQGGFRDCAKRYLESLAQPSSRFKHHPTLDFLAGSAERDICRLLNIPCGGRHFSCLGLAAYRGYSDMVQLLLDHSADPNFPDDPGEHPHGSALTQAVYYEHSAIVHTLLDHDADPNVQGVSFR
jgi:hypothetical protein